MSGKGTIYFPLAEVASLVMEATVAKEHTSSWLDAEEGRTTGPALMWVKDDGTYLMTNVTLPEGLRHTVVYGAASPDGPRLDGSQWDLCRDICGGDDFAEYLTVAELSRMIMGGHGEGLRWFVIEVDGDTIGISVQ